MNILILGSGGREFSIGLSIFKENAHNLFFMPGNGATDKLGTNINIKDYKQVLLQDNDIIFIPATSSVISINGEVLFPNSIAYNRSSIKYYVSKAGGFTDDADKKKAAVIHADGSSERVSMDYSPKAGDEVLIMPKIKFKWFPLMKDVSDIIFNAAVTARVLLFLK